MGLEDPERGIVGAGPQRPDLSDDPRPPSGKPWVPPTLTLMGTINDLVLGGGKASAANDPDPLAVTKGGTV